MIKAVFIAYNQSITEEVQQVLENLSIRGYTQWIDVKGRGSINGEPHQGSHTWPELNNAHIVFVEEIKVAILLEKLQLLNSKAEEQGLRAFVWSVENIM